jgi:hypothetical protein
MGSKVTNTENLGGPRPFNGRDVGRTYADSTPNGPRWYWSIYGVNCAAAAPRRRGAGADDLKAAKTVFKDNWERLLAAGSVKP